MLTFTLSLPFSCLQAVELNIYFEFIPFTLLVLLQVVELNIYFEFTK